MPTRKYLTEEKFNKWLQNDWLHMNRKVYYLLGTSAVTVAGVVAVLIKVW